MLKSVIVILLYMIYSLYLYINGVALSRLVFFVSTLFVMSYLYGLNKIDLTCYIWLFTFICIMYNFLYITKDMSSSAVLMQKTICDMSYSTLKIGYHHVNKLI